MTPKGERSGTTPCVTESVPNLRRERDSRGGEAGRKQRWHGLPVGRGHGTLPTMAPDRAETNKRTERIMYRILYWSRGHRQWRWTVPVATLAQAEADLAVLRQYGVKRAKIHRIK